MMINGALAAYSGPLPDELMSEIFLNCLDFGDHDIDNTDPCSTTAPLVPSWVCRHWRQICLSTPRLWTRITLQDLTVDGLFAKDRSHLLNLLDIWITRSASCPISIKFSYTYLLDDHGIRPMLFLPEEDTNGPYLQDMRNLTNKLLSCRDRWLSMDITVLDLLVIEPLLDAISEQPSAPLLEHLSIATQYLGIFGEIKTYNLALSSNLQTIHILSPLIIPSANELQFNRLTHLELKYCSSMAGCLQWLDKAPNLETLQVRFITAEPQTLEPEARIRRLERLRTLEVSAFSSDSDPGPLIDLLELPALTDLFIDTGDIIDSNEWPCVHNLLRRSQPPLFESLTLLGTPMDSEEIMDCLRLSPGLTYLNLGSVTDDILVSLSSSTPYNPRLPGASRAQIPLCPNLEVLEIGDTEDCSIPYVIHMVSSRCKNKTSLPGENLSSPSISVGSDLHKTLEILIIPPDPSYTIVAHPDIVHCLELGLDVVHREHM